MEYVTRTPGQLGSVLRSCRNQRGLTQREMGAKVGLKQSTVSNMEANVARTHVESLYKALSSLGLELVIRDRHAVGIAEKTREW